MTSLSQDIKNENLPKYDDRIAWEDRSIKVFWRYEPCYVWLDEFEEWYEWFINPKLWFAGLNNHGEWHEGFIDNPEENKRDAKLNLCPALPLEHAQYFESNYAGLVELNPKAPPDKQDGMEAPKGVTEAFGDDGAGSQADKTYKQRFTSLGNLLTNSPLKLDDFDTNRAIFQALQKTGDKDKNGKPLWNIKCETGSDSFYTEFFRRYCKDTGYKRKGRKERLKNRQ